MEARWLSLVETDRPPVCRMTAYPIVSAIAAGRMPPGCDVGAAARDGDSLDEKAANRRLLLLDFIYTQGIALTFSML